MGLFKALFGEKADARDAQARAFASGLSQRVTALLSDVQEAMPELSGVTTSEWTAAACSAALKAAPLVLASRGRLHTDWRPAMTRTAAALRGLGVRLTDTPGKHDADFGPVADHAMAGDMAAASTSTDRMIGGWVLTDLLRVPHVSDGAAAGAAPLGKAISRAILAAWDAATP
jgi:hypothetical protein